MITLKIRAKKIAEETDKEIINQEIDEWRNQISDYIREINDLKLKLENANNRYELWKLAKKYKEERL